MNHPTANIPLALILQLILGVSFAGMAVPGIHALASPYQEPAKITAPPQPEEEPASSSSTAADPSRGTNSIKRPEYSMARGIVFSDLDGDGKYGDNDAAFAGVKVSNGHDIVLTDVSGRYELPVEPDAAIFVIKPSGYRSSLDKNNLPQFYYLHKPDGSPKLKFPGSNPTGPLPQSIDFPLYEQQEPETFKILLFGDPQPRTDVEVDYIAHDVVSELIGSDSSFGVTLGDIAFDDLNTFKTLNQTIAMIGIPWYNVIGNHDLNLDATERKFINETYEATYGPSYYSFDYGQVHFVVLDNIDWVAPTQTINRWHYQGGFGKQQLDFLKKDLSMIPETQMVVLLMHIPIITVTDKGEFFELIEQRPYCVSVSAHTHDHRHLFLGEKDGFNGEKKHHHIVNVTVSGSWWSGAQNDNGIPHATMTDGAPNGYSIMTFDETGYKLDFKAAGRPANEQLRVRVADTLDTNQTGEAEVWVNVYNGSEQSSVQMSIDNDGGWIELEKQIVPDPHFVELYERDAGIKLSLAKPTVSYHLWTGKLPAEIPPGAHLVRVKTTDRHGRTYHAHRSLRVTGEPVRQTQPGVVKAQVNGAGSPAASTSAENY